MGADESIKCWECKKRNGNINPKENHPEEYPFRCNSGKRKEANDTCPFGERGDPIINHTKNAVKRTIQA